MTLVVPVGLVGENFKTDLSLFADFRPITYRRGSSATLGGGSVRIDSCHAVMWVKGIIGSLCRVVRGRCTKPSIELLRSGPSIQDVKERHESTAPIDQPGVLPARGARRSGPLGVARLGQVWRVWRIWRMTWGFQQEIADALLCSRWRTCRDRAQALS